MNKLQINSPAKINLCLFVTEKRTDNYHNIETIFYPIFDLCDVLTFEMSEKFFFTSNRQELITEDNLILKAKKLLEEKTNKKFNFKIHLEKKIPMGAGLGGGSSNAATTLISLNEMYDLKLPYEELSQIGLSLGSDVPFFLKSKPSYATSRGEILNQLDFSIEKPILIVNPNIHISTKLAYQNVKPRMRKIDLSILSRIKNDFSILKNYWTNDFEEYVFHNYPEIKNIKEMMYDNGAEFSLMTGSGSTVFGIFNRLEEVERVSEKISKKYFSFLSYLS